MKILLICHDIPSLTVGATLPFYHLIRNLGEVYDIDLVSFDSGKYDKTELESYINTIDTLPIPEYLDIKNQLMYTVKNMITFDNLRTRSFLNYYYDNKMSEFIRQKVSCSYDVIITDMPMAFYAKNINVPKIVYAFDAVSNYNYNMFKKAETLPERIYWYMNYFKIHRYEKVYNSFDLCVVVNNKDKLLLEKDIQIPIDVISNGVDTEFFKNTDKKSELRLVFLGDMSTPPNNDAVSFFVDKIYPNVLKEEDINLYIVGRNPSEYIKTLENEHIKVTGSVEDVRSYLTRNSIFITPMISGTGIKNKILEAMSMGLAVVSTSTGISGISAENEKEFLLARDEVEFKNQVLRLIRDDTLREKIGINARKFVESQYSWNISMDKLRKNIESITDK